MLSLFNTTDLNRATQYRSALDRFVRQSKAGLEKLIRHHRSMSMGIGSNHVLVDLVYRLPNIGESSLNEYLEKVRRDEVDIANALGFVNSAGKGKVRTHEFYPGPNVILLNRKSLTFHEILRTENWKEMESVKAIKIPFYWNGLNLPDGKEDDYDKASFSAVSINIVAVAYMYYLWREEQSEADLDQRETRELFVSRYVLPNILRSQFDAAMINSYLAAINSIPYLIDDRTAKLLVPDNQRQIHDELEDLLEKIPSKGASIETVMKSLPLAYSDSFSDFVPDLGDQVALQNYWGLMVALVDLSDILVQLMSQSSERSRLDNRLKVVRRYEKGNRVLSRIPDHGLRSLAEVRYKEILD